jgi:hypothetical protein
MRTFVTGTLLATSILVVVACGKKQDDTPQPTTPQPGYGQPGYGQPGTTPPGYPQPQPQPTYGTPQPYPTTTAAPTATAPAAPGQMAVPGPLAFPCQNDSACGLHHCNLQYQKCAFPCATEADCINPNACVAGVCLPKTQ